MGINEAIQILALLLTFISGGITEHETQIITEYTYYPVDSNNTKCLKSSKIMLK